MTRLTTVPTSITLTPEQFERLYLNPLMHRQGHFQKQLGNPTPLGLGGFVLTTTPLSCNLMGWRGAGLNGIAYTGPIIFLGGGCLFITAILEFILGNTFTSIVFGTIGAFWFAFGTTMVPSFNAAAPYSASTTDTVAGLNEPKFLDSYGFFFLSMALLMVIFLICSTRTNVVFVLIFTSLTMVFVLLTAAYWRLALADMVVGNRLVVGAGASLFVTSLLGWYMLLAQLVDSVGFPLPVPVGDLSHFWNRNKQHSAQDLETNAAAIGNGHDDK